MGDFTVVVTGQKFVSGAVVTFGGAFLPTTFISSTELTATGTATSAQAGTVQVTVINPDPGSLTSNAFALEVGTSANTLSASAAARLLEQSTWGVNPQSLSHVQAVGMQAFLNEQFAAPVSTYPAPASTDDMSFVQKRFFTNALTGQDQLRQRVAWGLSQIMVASAVKINNPSAFVLWQNMFQNDAFGNFSTLLTDVTLSPVMGNYLDMVNNDKPNNGVDPNENYAREVLQLFSIGLEQLNQDGTPQLDGSGNPIPTYTQDTIEGFAHVFTGWTYPTKPGATAQFRNPEYYGGPMIPFDSHHDTGSKLLLNGVTLPAGGTTPGDLDGGAAEHFQSSQRRTVHLQATDQAPGDQQSQPRLCWPGGGGIRRQRHRSTWRPESCGHGHPAGSRSAARRRSRTGAAQRRQAQGAGPVHHQPAARR